MTISNDMLLEILVWLVGVLGSTLIATLIWMGKAFIGRVDNMDGKLDTMHDAMLSCDGCREALKIVGESKARRMTDK